MSLPADAVPTRHVFLADALTQGTTCLVCGETEDFGALHIPVEPRRPDPGEWQHRDILLNPKTGGIFACRHADFGVEFLELYPTHAQNTPPADAVLLVRKGEPVCRCLGCAR